MLLRNLAVHSGDDGIDVRAPGTTVTRNIANDNHNLGISAVPGVIDGGGNQAAGNGDRPSAQTSPAGNGDPSCDHREEGS